MEDKLTESVLTEEEQLEEPVAPVSESEEDDLKELFTTLIIDQEEPNGTMEVEASEAELGIFKQVCEENSVSYKVEELGENKYIVSWDRDAIPEKEADAVVNLETAEQVKAKLLSAVEYMEEIIHSSNATFSAGTFAEDAAKEIAEAAELIKKFSF